MLTRTKYFWILTALAVLLLAAAQCGPAGQQDSSQTEAKAVSSSEGDPHIKPTAALAPVSLDAGQKLKVVATTSIIADVVSNVGGDRIELAELLPIGADPHTFQPAPRDLASVAEAHVVFANGMGLEGFLDQMIKNAGGEAAIVYVSENITPRQFAAGDAHEHESGQSEQSRQAGGQDQLHPGADPHTWTSPANIIIFVHNIERTLSALDPAGAETYGANAQRYETRVEELDAWVKSQIETIPPENRKLVTDHTTFGYYADRYGLEQVGAVIPSFSTAAEPSAQELAKLEDAIKAYGVKAVFVGASVNPTLSEQVARDTGIRLVTLYTGSLGPAGSGAETYLDYIRYNTGAIVDALK